MKSCPDNAGLVAFAEGALSDRQRDSVALHLDGCPHCAELVAQAAEAITESLHTQLYSGGQPVRVPSPRLVRGTSVGKYLVVGQLGSGGLGDVYVGYDSDLDRRVALKLVRPVAARRVDPERLRARLVQEARALARVSHPNVVHVYEVDRVDGDVFIAMELVEGVTLRTWLRERPRRWRDIRDKLVDAGRGLAAAHAVGLVHRDFKPENVLVGTDGRVRVLDFGLAHAIANSAGEELLPTERDTEQPQAEDPGCLVGTPPYMAPEQYTGSPVDPRTDQFGFCVSLYEALYGHRPFLGRGPALREAIMRGEPQPPPAEIRVPSWLHRAVIRGLAVEPRRRHASMEDLLAALQRDARSRRSNAFALVAAGLLSAGAAVGATRLTDRASDPDPAMSTARIDDLSEAARYAAEAGFFVYPPPDGPADASAYRRILQLEALAAAGSPRAMQQALALRREFARALIALGESFEQLEGGQPYATDYFAAAQILDPSARGLDIALTPGELAALRQKATTAAFSERELEAGAALAALSTLEPAQRRSRLGARPKRQRSFATPDPLGPDRPPVDEERERDAAQAPVPSDASRSRPPDSPDSPADPTSSTSAHTAVQAGKAALRRLRLDEAEQHFHRALRSNRDDYDALLGLAEVDFQRGEFGNALRRAERAAASHPRRSRAFVEIGNACFRLLRYDDALAAYRKAEALGSRSAKRLRRRLEKKIGL